MPRSQRVFLAALAALVCAAPASAQQRNPNALVPGSIAGFALQSNFTGTLGWQFTVNSTITVTQLGFFDDQTPLLRPHNLAVFDLTGAVYAYGAVAPNPNPLDPADPLSALFTFAPVTMSLPLAPGKDYVIAGDLTGGGGTTTPTGDPYFFDDGSGTASLSTAPEITFVGDRSHVSPAGVPPTLTFPELTSDPALQPVYSYFGPDFQFVDGSHPIGIGGPTVPEPGPLPLLALGLPLLLAAARRRGGA